MKGEIDEQLKWKIKIEPFCCAVIDSHSWVGKTGHSKNKRIENESMVIIKQEEHAWRVGWCQS